MEMTKPQIPTNLLTELRVALHEEMRVCILPFWMYKASDQQNGGYWGSIKADGYIDKQADKGGILHARLLWAFSQAHLSFGDQGYADHASRTLWFIRQQLTRADGKELLWSNQRGADFETEDDWLICQAYYLYALSAYGMFDTDAKQQSQVVFEYLRPKIQEALTLSGPAGQLWRTYLHIAEALDCYCRVHRYDPKAINLMQKLLERAVNLFQSATTTDLINLNWGRVAASSWLLQLFSSRYASAELKQTVDNCALSLTSQITSQAIQTPAQGVGLSVEDDTRYGWVQAEVLASLWFNWRKTQQPQDLSLVTQQWQFIHEHISDRQFGEWRSQATNQAGENLEKAGFWKCPYHNFRACLSIYRAISELTKTQQ